MENINLSNRLTKTHIAARLFDEGDHWQKGAAFLPFVSLDSSNQAAQRAQMEASLETEDIVGEVLDNEQNAVFGRETDWQIVSPVENEDAPTPADIIARELAEEAEKPVVSYWNDYNCLGTLKDTNRRAATQERCFIRGYVPKGLVSDDPQRNKKENARAAMGLLRFEVLPSDVGGVFVDKETHQKYGLFKTMTEDGANLTEICFVENGITYVRTIRETNNIANANATLPTLKAYMSDGKRVIDEVSYDLGGELLYFEVRRKPLITESVISNQKDVNLCLTAKNRLTYKHAYPDLFFWNTKQPLDADGKPTSIKTGGKSANFLTGEDVIDKNTGQITNYANGSMTVLNPTDSSHTIKSKEASAFAIYNQTSQVHLTKNLSADASGVSKRESRFSFEKKCLEVKQMMDACGRWMLKVLTLFAADNLGETSKYKLFRYDFNCRIDAGAPDAEEIRQAAQDVKDGFLDEETYLSKYLRFDDADAVKARLARSESYQIAVWQKRLETAKAAREMGLPALEWVGILYPGNEGKQKEIIQTMQGSAPAPIPLPISQ